MKGHGYVTLPSRLVGAVLGDSDVSTSAGWSTGHSAIHPLVTWGRGQWVAPLDLVVVTSFDGPTSTLFLCFVEMNG